MSIYRKYRIFSLKGVVCAYLRVTIIDFGLSNVIDPDESARKAGLERCSRLCLRTEMRKVKFLLDWKCSRETEFRLAKLRSAREERDRAAANAIMNSEVVVPKEPMSEEEKEVSSRKSS